MRRVNIASIAAFLASAPAMAQSGFDPSILASLQAQIAEHARSVMSGMFHRADTNGDGYLTQEEVRQFVASNGGDGDIQDNPMFRAADRDGDGRLSYSEFMAGVDQEIAMRPGAAAGQ